MPLARRRPFALLALVPLAAAVGPGAWGAPDSECPWPLYLGGRAAALSAVPAGAAPYIVAASSVPARQHLVSAVTTLPPPDTAVVLRSFERLPFFTVNATRGALRHLCTQPALANLVSYVERDAVVSLGD